MQIDGMREFFSKVTLLNRIAGVQNNTVLSALVQQKQSAHDSLMLSDIGKRLSFNTGESSSLVTKRKTELPDSLPPWAQKIDKALSQAADILERMRALAIAAQSEKISDLDRIEMQIEIEDLRANLMNVCGSSARPPHFSAPMFVKDGEAYCDYSSVLGRARERIIRGQKWDVREVWCPEGFTRTAYDDNGEEFVESFEAGEWYVVEDRNVLTRSKEGKFVDSGRKVETVRELLEWADTVIVMDAKSAAMGVERLEGQIASIQKWREQLPESANTAVAFLSSFVTANNGFNPSLTDSVMIASNFLYSDGIYDEPLSKKSLKSDGRDCDIVLTNREAIENDMIAADGLNEDDERIGEYSVLKLSEEYV
jgi:hypothetical protein